MRYASPLALVISLIAVLNGTLSKAIVILPLTDSSVTILASERAEIAVKTSRTSPSCTFRVTLGAAKATVVLLKAKSAARVVLRSDFFQECISYSSLGSNEADFADGSGQQNRCR